MDGELDGIDLWVQRPGAPDARRLFVGRLDGVPDPVVAVRTDAGARILAVLVDDAAEAELTELLSTLPDAAIAVRDATPIDARSPEDPPWT